MSGLSKLCKTYGRMIINGEKWIYDYVHDKPRAAKEMTAAEIRASEKAKWEIIKKASNG